MNFQRDEIAGVFEASGIALLSSVVLCYVFANACLILGCGLSSIIFPVAIILGLCISIRRISNRKGLLLAGLVLGYAILALLLATFTYDTSFDGAFYHQQAVISLAEGWNPFRMSNLTGDFYLWTLHYAKSIETVAASIVAFCGNIEAGKAVNLLLYGSLLFLLCGVCLRAFKTRRFLPVLLCAIAMASNPVVISQMFTYYVDYPKYVYLVWTIWLIYRLTQDKRNSTYFGFLLIGVVVLAMGTKFNMFFEAGLWLVLALVWFIFHKDFYMVKALVIIGLGSLVCGVFIAWHPYVTNYILADNPFYPLLGSDSVDIMTGNTPDELHYGRFGNFLVSLFTVDWPSYDRRLGGYGPLMPAVLAFSVYILWRERHNVRPVVLYIALCCVGSVFIFDQSWWARYNAQLWLLPAVALFVGFKATGRRKASYWLLAFMLLSIPPALAREIRMQYISHPYYAILYGQLKGKEVAVFQNSRHFQSRLEAKDIKVKSIGTITEEELKRAWYFYGFGANTIGLKCFPVVVPDSATSAEIFREIESKGLPTSYYRPADSADL